MRATLQTLTVACCGPAGGQLVCYEGFEGYAAGVQLESGSGNGRNGGTGWGGAYDVHDPLRSKIRIEDRGSISSAGPVSYSNGEITLPGGIRALRFYDNADGSYAVSRPLGTVFEAESGHPLWFSILFRTGPGGASPLANQDLFQIGFDDTANPASGNPRVSIGSNTVSSTFPSEARFFARSTTDPLASVFYEAVPIAAGTTYLLVAQIQPSEGIYHTVSLYINPAGLADPGPPSATVALPSGLSALSHAFIRTAFLDTNDAYVLDEWRIGRDYASVVGSLRNLLEILPAGSPGGGWTLRWPALMPGVVLESSASLEPGSWESLTGSFAQSAGYWSHAVPIEPENPRRFFRLTR